jgi:hypothetical protein
LQKEALSFFFCARSARNLLQAVLFEKKNQKTFMNSHVIMIDTGHWSVFTLTVMRKQGPKRSGLCFGAQFYHRADHSMKKAGERSPAFFPCRPCAGVSCCSGYP